MSDRLTISVTVIAQPGLFSLIQNIASEMSFDERAE